VLNSVPIKPQLDYEIIRRVHCFVNRTDLAATDLDLSDISTYLEEWRANGRLILHGHSDSLAETCHCRPGYSEWRSNSSRCSRKKNAETQISTTRSTANEDNKSIRRVAIKSL